MGTIKLYEVCAIYRASSPAIMSIMLIYGELLVVNPSDGWLGLCFVIMQFNCCQRAKQEWHGTINMRCDMDG